MTVCDCLAVVVRLSFLSWLVFKALEEYGTQESTEQNNSELETKMEVARQSLRRAEVNARVCVLLLSKKWISLFSQSVSWRWPQCATCWLNYCITGQCWFVKALNICWFKPRCEYFLSWSWFSFVLLTRLWLSAFTNKTNQRGSAHHKNASLFPFPHWIKRTTGVNNRPKSIPLANSFSYILLSAFIVLSCLLICFLFCDDRRWKQKQRPVWTCWGRRVLLSKRGWRAPWTRSWRSWRTNAGTTSVPMILRSL